MTVKLCLQFRYIQCSVTIYYPKRVPCHNMVKRRVTMIKTFAVVGDDRRLGFAAVRLRSYGFEVNRFVDFVDVGIVNADGILLSVVGEGNARNVARLSDITLPETVFFGGNMPQALIKKMERSGHRVFDYCRRDDYRQGNAVPTARGAVMIARRYSGLDLNASNVLVTGFGCVARELCRQLAERKCTVTVAARNPQAREEAASSGYRTADFDDIAGMKNEYDAVFGTVPSIVLSGERLGVLRDTLYIELASSPGGVDIDGARMLGCRIIPAPSLPGRLFPETAGGVLCDTVLKIIEEEKI